MPITMDDMKLITGYTRDGINKILQRYELRTGLPKVDSGRSRLFTRENALELGFTCNLMRHNVDGEDALKVASFWLTAEQEGHLPVFWVFDPKREYVGKDGVLSGYGFSDREKLMAMIAAPISDDPDTGGKDQDNLSAKLQHAASMIVINLREIVRRVDYAEDAST